MTTCHDTLLIRDFYDQTMLYGYFQSEFVRPAMQVSPKPVRFSMWSLFPPTNYIS